MLLSGILKLLEKLPKKIPDFIKQKYPDVPWAEMYLLRNKVSHEYFGIDYDLKI